MRPYRDEDAPLGSALPGDAASNALEAMVLATFLHAMAPGALGASRMPQASSAS
ncbi:hypothetical protein LXT23_48580 [Pyxidicoccus sp. QH1ED-7-1]|nr:hypothetical protein [Pyxidicoccus xibeiensis]